MTVSVFMKRLLPDRELSGWGNKGCEVLGRHRPSIEKALHLVAAGGPQEFKLLFGLHAFRYDTKLKAVSKRDDCADNGAVAGIGRDVAHEELVDLQPVDGEPL